MASGKAEREQGESEDGSWKKGGDAYVTGAKVVHFPQTANFFRGKFRGARKIPRKIPTIAEFYIV